MTAEISSLGEYLRHERERRGITIEQVASATKIGVRTLHSLEGDHYADLPAKPFIRGFVISYCRFIGLDAKEVLSSYTDFIAKKSTERPNREGGHSGYAFEKRDGEQQSRTLLFVAIFSFTIVGGVAVLVLKPSLHHRKNSHIDRLRAAHVQGTEGVPADAALVVASVAKPGDGAHDGKNEQKPEQPVDPKAPATTPLVLKQNSLGLTAPEVSLSAQVGSAEAKPTPASSEAAPEPKPLKPATETVTQSEEKPTVDKVTESEKVGADPEDPLDSGHRLSSTDTHYRAVFKIKDDVWVRYQVDQKPVRKFIIRAGKSLVLKGKEKIIIQVSHPDRVEFSYNSHAFVEMDNSKSVHNKQGDATLVFPSEMAKGLESPFSDKKVLPKTIAKSPGKPFAPGENGPIESKTP